MLQKLSRNPKYSVDIKSILKICLSILFYICISIQSNAQEEDKSIPDILKIPRLAPGLEVGTIAWATPDQLHPTQAQTGKREVKRKTQEYLQLINTDKSKFSRAYYEMVFKKIIAPVYLGAVPKKDSRKNMESFLGYLSDRTHGVNALSEVIRLTYGAAALSQALYDNEGRPLNFILVRVMEDSTQIPHDDFIKSMVDNKHAYLKFWSRKKSGDTKIEKIDFSDLPEKVYETTDNPYRGLIGELQHAKKLGRSNSDYSQFIDAEALVKNSIVDWDDITLDAKEEIYQKAFNKASDFFSSPAAKGLPGVEYLKNFQMSLDNFMDTVIGQTNKCQQILSL